MILEQVYLDCLAQASYFIADERTKRAVVVDPRRDVQVYLDLARRHGVTIGHVVLTHFHADFLAGHLELRERTRATICLGAAAQAGYAFEPLRENDTIELGDVRLRVLETPGHTPESISLLVYDDARDPSAPHAVLTGDCLFVGSVGRPDLMASIGITAEQLANRMYDTLRDKLMRLPDETIVYPGHGPGSACGKGLGSERSSTIGKEKRSNHALQPMSREDFVAMLTAGQPDAPAYFAYDAGLNKAERPLLDEVLEHGSRAVPLEEALRLQNAGSWVLDTRAADAFAAGHLPGSLNIGLGGKYASWAGTLLPTDASILLIAEPGTEREAAMRLGRIGFDRIDGHLAGGFATVATDPQLVRRGRRLEPDVLRGELDAQQPPLVVDVRTDGEWENGHIDGALHVPLTRLQASLDEIPRDRELVLVCQSGYRSSTAASLLESAGYGDVADLRGGMLAWSGGAASCAVTPP